MTDYIYDEIKVSADSDFTISISFEDEAGETIQFDEVYMKLFDDNKNVITDVKATVNAEDKTKYDFYFTADSVKGLKGRYFYTFHTSDEDVIFPAAIYFI